MRISLHDCLNARYPIPPDEYIKCAEGHELKNIHIRQFDKGTPLILAVCQSCPDFEDMNDLTLDKDNANIEKGGNGNDTTRNMP